MGEPEIMKDGEAASSQTVISNPETLLRQAMNPMTSSFPSKC